MPKSNGAAPKFETHFETVPVEVVKKIAREDLSEPNIRPVAETSERPVKKRLRAPVPTRAPAGKRT